MLNRTAIVLVISGLSLTTFLNKGLCDPEDFQYGTTVAMETAGVVLSVAMAKAATTPLQRVAYTAAAIGTAGAMAMTISNWLQSDQSGDPNSPGGSGDFGSGSGSTPLGGTDPIDLGFDDIPIGSVDDPSNPNYPGSGNPNSIRNGNTDVALDLLNSDPDSGFGADSLNNRDLASSGSGGSIGGGLNSSSFDKKDGASLLADAIEKELSSWKPQDIEKLRAGDQALIGSLMDSLGIEGNPNGIDFSMFSNMLNGMFKGDKDQQQYNGVLASELLNRKLSIFETIKKTTVVAATEYHPKAFRITSGPVIASAKPKPVIPRPTAVGISPKLAQMTDGAKAPGHDEAKFSMMPRKIGAGHE